VIEKPASLGTAIRPAVPDDVAAIARIYNHAIRTGTATFDVEEKTIDDRRGWLRNRGQRSPVMIAAIAGNTVGYGALSPWSDRQAYDETAEIGIYVDEASRQRGVGRALGDELLAVGRSRGIHTVLARITVGNDASVRLFQGLGFVLVGVMHGVGRKLGRRLDVALYESVLSGDQTADVPRDQAS
jgi:phosphinothricin acetyltransferase